jgi:tetratricopeptide (TPR) repeat protein
MPPKLLTCGFCSKTGPDFLVCARCKVASYCSKTCQTKGWKANHKRECVEAKTALAHTVIKSLVDSDIQNYVEKHSRNLRKLMEFAVAEDWFSVLSIEREVMACNWQGPTASTLFATLGNTHSFCLNWEKAILYYEKQIAVQKTILEEDDDAQRLCSAYGNLGAMYNKIGNNDKGIECQTACLEMAKVLENEFEEARAYAQLGISYEQKGEFARAINFNHQSLAIFKKDGDLEKQSKVYNALGMCHLAMNELEKAMSFFNEMKACLVRASTYVNQDLLRVPSEENPRGEDEAGAATDEAGAATDEASNQVENTLKYLQRNRDMQTGVDLNIGITLTFQIREARKNSLRADLQDLQWLFSADVDAAGTDVERRSPAARALVAQRLDSMLCEAACLLHSTLEKGHTSANLYIAYLKFDAGEESAALKFLKDYLTWLVKRGPKFCCGCGQTRSEDTHMLKCSGCKAARFCSVDHQKMACKKISAGGNVRMGRHNDVCGLLGKWRMVVKHGVPPESCTEDMLAFLKAWKERSKV